MSDPTVIHDTFVIERTYRASLARVFAQLADPVRKRRWYGEGDNHVVERFEIDFREGGAERTAYRLNDNTPLPGAVIANEGIYQDITPNQRVVLATSMTIEGRRVSCSLITFELLDRGGATELVLTHQGVFYEGSGGPQMRKDGWEKLLDALGRAVDETAAVA
jgi:uncharacterized protein YndB with AHSA1/START domain